tara:strand:+ start:9465 stop:10337 length:873 start_codon:yes stop_codon:yes gene_type:complete
MDIKHIVLSGGAQYGLSLIGALYECENNNMINYNNIEKVYGTSAGSVALVIWMLRISKEDIYNFLINRPWEKTIKLESKIISSFLDKKGIINKKFIYDIITPLLRANSLNENITLEEFFNYTKKEIHIIATKLDTLEYIDFSYKTHPKLSLIDSIYMSSTIPCVMQPMYYNDTYIIDGGLSYGYPIKLCKEENPDDNNHILGIKIIKNDKEQVKPEQSLLFYVFSIIEKMRDKVNNFNESEAKYQINILSEIWLTRNFKECLDNKNKRRELIELGEINVKKYLDNSVKKI